MKFSAALLAILVLCSYAPSQSSSAKHVKVASKLVGGTIKAGDTFKAEIKLTIAKGWHINSHAPSQDYMIGTAFLAEPQEGYTVTDVQYPKEQSVKLSIAETPFSVYDGTVTITVTIKTSADVHKGKNIFQGKLTFQACNDQICVAPSSVPVSIPVTIGS